MVHRDDDTRRARDNDARQTMACDGAPAPRRWLRRATRMTTPLHIINSLFYYLFRFILFELCTFRIYNTYISSSSTTDEQETKTNVIQRTAKTARDNWKAKRNKT